MDLNKKVQSPWAKVQSATAQASYDNLPLDFKKLNLGGPTKPNNQGSGGSNHNRKRTNSRKKIRKNRRANKTRRYKK